MTAANKVALITGAAKRIGKQTATVLHKLGYDIVVHCNRSLNDAETFVQELNLLRSNSAKVVQADITKFDQLEPMAAASTQAFGRIDMLVNNASSFYPTDVADVDEHIWNDLMGTNLKAPFFLIKYLADELASNKGNVVNMVDIHADRPLKDYSVYCIAKAGLVMLTKSLSRELAPNIRVNGIAPGAILWHENDLSEQDKAQVLSEIGLERLGSPEDIAQAIAYMSSASYVTGQILAVDGGRSVNGGRKA